MYLTHGLRSEGYNLFIFNILHHSTFFPSSQFNIYSFQLDMGKFDTDYEMFVHSQSEIRIEISTLEMEITMLMENNVDLVMDKVS